ncbi:hypothetical protein P154DRAFT_578893 [Amniculicola lignicola CBS 123094]|uniref:F-box domain-containing protein n=1 Tax=Amniculicola lignicola CBS 123094 TaxID=1392246 RepID=A0A6A5W9D5_9PLEO|nr:hypothetical protein P154DRAFT_578893 [Amniculicola lignicola CBS 123094]
MESSSPISLLPSEIVDNVFTFLGFADVKNVRLVCRGFHDCAFPAMGEKFGSTVIDLYSKPGVEMLKGLMRKGLAPHVKMLRFGCGAIVRAYLGYWFEVMGVDVKEGGVGNLEGRVEEKDNGQNGDDGKLADRAKCFTDERIVSEVEQRISRRMLDQYFRLPAEEVFHQGVWTPQPGYSGEDCYPSDEHRIQKDLATATLASIFSSCTNLRTVHYCKIFSTTSLYGLVIDVLGPKAFPVGHYKFEYEQKMVHLMTVDIILRALAQSHTFVRDLRIPVLVTYLHTLKSLTHTSVLKEALAKTEHLQLDQASDGHWVPEPHSPNSPLFLTLETVPFLKHLRLESLGNEEQQLPRWLEISLPPGPPLRLTRLTLQGHKWGKPGSKMDMGFIAFLFSMRSTLKFLRLCKMYFLNWPEFLNIFPKGGTSLEELVLEMVDFPDRYAVNMLVPLKLLYAAASKISMRDIYLNRLKAHWMAMVPPGDDFGMLMMIEMSESIYYLDRDGKLYGE